MFDSNGNLPPGQYEMDIDQISKDFGFNAWRLELIDGLIKGVAQLSKYAIEAVYIDGSFATEKPIPGDFDACWDDRSMTDTELLKMKKANPEFFFIEVGTMKKLYKGEFYPLNSSGMNMLDFFQLDRDGNKKGIIKLKL